MQARWLAVWLILIIVVLGYALPDDDEKTDREPAPRTETDAALRAVQDLEALGRTAVEAGVATEFDVSGWTKSLDLTISSLLPGDARDLADATCEVGRERGRASGWKVRVFLPVGGDRPAASCKI